MCIDTNQQTSKQTNKHKLHHTASTRTHHVHAPHMSVQTRGRVRRMYTAIPARCPSHVCYTIHVHAGHHPALHGGTRAYPSPLGHTRRYSGAPAGIMLGLVEAGRHRFGKQHLLN